MYEYNCDYKTRYKQICICFCQEYFVPPITTLAPMTDTSYTTTLLKSSLSSTIPKRYTIIPNSTNATTSASTKTTTITSKTTDLVTSDIIFEETTKCCDWPSTWFTTKSVTPRIIEDTTKTTTTKLMTPHTTKFISTTPTLEFRGETECCDRPSTWVTTVSPNSITYTFESETTKKHTSTHKLTDSTTRMSTWSSMMTTVPSIITSEPSTTATTSTHAPNTKTTAAYTTHRTTYIPNWHTWFDHSETPSTIPDRTSAKLTNETSWLTKITNQPTAMRETKESWSYWPPKSNNTTPAWWYPRFCANPGCEYPKDWYSSTKNIKRKHKKYKSLMELLRNSINV
ncbi:salivary glue protein Sgs-3-like isoform X2 [Pectinophora gossypiella]|nr:salivary glue protein Sgs-3-like isoform X2 [Pectinophora gossypiella]XP_049886149.1 salivary glue protein Sgs-3-like isoform X2 [Pectinophora gossypiella]XP_049886150.1 salivary glue protein Sgs-3-like isoform X2 [Pectinophora gossypiella]XP_049886151.1 salivary glue protein Sgs-3-like isoform X2 [Pectinophora gossypiella]XP_049886153.1 salivary glue protein Sgs-3-like isoform X2 [Pectinophora gossypiella]